MMSKSVGVLLALILAALLLATTSVMVVKSADQIRSDGHGSASDSEMDAFILKSEAAQLAAPMLAREDSPGNEAVVSALGVQDAPLPPLEITKSGPDRTMGGVPIGYALVVTNNLSTTLTGVVITDRLPLGSVYSSGGTLHGDVVSWTVPSMGAGLALTRQFTVTARSTITNSDYSVTTQEGYRATGKEAVVTEVFNEIYLPSVTRDYCEDFLYDFFDDFSDRYSGWYVGDDAYVRSEYLNGEYRILTKNADYFYLYSAPTCARGNYVVETDVRWEGGTGYSYGLMFGMQDDFERYYLLEVNTDYQMYIIWRRDSSGWTKIAPVAASGAIHSGTASNHLKVTRNTTQITLYVNGAYLGSWYDGAISGLTEVGVISSPYSDQAVSDARFDNFKVTRLTNTESSGYQQAQRLAAPAVAGQRSAEENAGLIRLPSWQDD